LGGAWSNNPPAEIGQNIVRHKWALIAARKVGVPVAYVKPHGALETLQPDRDVADAFSKLSKDRPQTRHSHDFWHPGKHAARANVPVLSEILRTRIICHLAAIPRNQDGAMIHDAAEA
jgi:lactam utilization protein B